MKEDRRVTFGEIETSRIGLVAAQNTIHDHFYLRKRCSKWNGRFLMSEQAAIKMDFGRLILDNINNASSKTVFCVIAGDKLWIYQYDLTTKRKYVSIILIGSRNITVI